MFEFNGYISGSTQKMFIKKSRKFTQKIFFLAAIMFMPFFVYVAYRTRYWLLLGLYCTFFMAIIMFFYVPQSKKSLQAITPKRIYTEDDYIVCMADRYIEHRKISDVKQVIDHGEFYEIIFPFGKMSEKFLCQKSLLVKGTLEDFEDMFNVSVKRTR